MKGYKRFVIYFSVLLILYVLTELNKPQPIDWTVTISQIHKSPYGGYIISQRLKDIFPFADIQTYRTPVYDQVNNYRDTNTAYILMGPTFNPSKEDMNELKNYVVTGNYAFLSYQSLPNSFLDSFKIKTNTRFTFDTKDSTSINFVSPAIKSPKNYTFLRSTIDEYFSKIDTAYTVVLGTNDRGDANFIKIPYGDGAFFIHINPLCFSNYFLLHNDNALYASKALSFIPAKVSKVYWDEYYKLGRGGASTPFRFLLSNEYLRWALRVAMIGLILYVLFQMKRKQRIIPVIEPLKNSTLDFVRTVSGVYFNAKDNKGIAEKKISYWLEFVRNRFNLSTQLLDEDFAEQLSKKSGVNKNDIKQLITFIAELPSRQVNDSLLLTINNSIDNFYKQV